MQEQGAGKLAKVEKGVGAPQTAEALIVSPEYVRQTEVSLALLQQMVRETLKQVVDYGRTPGTPQDSLWDPGAQLIVGAFNTYFGTRRILRWVEDGTRIAVCFEVPVISRASGQEVGSGVGAASTMETKHKWRWVRDPQEWGYDEEAAKTLKYREDDDKYRIPNPEHEDLLNTIVKMAAKRAEVDAAESLPGAASALRELFTKSGFPPGKERKDRWSDFWGEVRRLGLTDEEAHAELKVQSMKAWLSKGRSLDDALKILRGAGKDEATEKKAGETPQGGPVEGVLSTTAGEPTSPTSEKLFEDLSQEAKEKREGGKQAPLHFANWGDLAKQAKDKGVQPSEVFARARVKAWTDFASYEDAWAFIQDIAKEKRN